MKSKTCPVCGGSMKRNGKTKSGRQRWRCLVCGSSTTHSINTDERDLSAFLSWLMSKDTQMDMPGCGRTFRRRTSKFWDIWPMPSCTGEVHRVVYVDGIYLAKNVCVLIACSDEHVLSWYLCRAETSHAWEALMSYIAPPEVVVTDGGSGFAKACRHIWPNTRIQRCLFHAFSQVKRYTTSRPNLLAGAELYGLAKELMHLDTLAQVDWWVERFGQWCSFWSDFLEEKSYIEGRFVYTHERLRKARSSLVTLSNQGTLFTYLDPKLCLEGSLPKTNNRIEGGVNAPLRSLLRNHRGMSLTRRIKAVFWWCYMKTENRLSASEILKEMPTDDDIDLLYEIYGTPQKPDSGAPRWGEGLVWEELHHKTVYPYSTE
ncbi:IS1249 family transposase [Adlercreutzia agrestimuris]|uniref:IS1249 family transposase n=1 Tax=Adlercreutzia agrestimuris TaxID=2941324 RepID=UPI0020415CEE|nr:IS1249 family transposase [Adlercreutzia agrestimuris]